MSSDDEEFDELPSAAEAKVASDERELPQFMTTHASAEGKKPEGPKRRRMSALDALSASASVPFNLRRGEQSISLSPTLERSRRRSFGARTAPPVSYAETPTRALCHGLLHWKARPGAFGSLPRAQNLVTRRIRSDTVVRDLETGRAARDPGDGDLVHELVTVTMK